ncbi:MAG: alpha/beta hydrolase [Spirochaetota bacterium]
MIVTSDMVDPELRLRGRIVDLINTPSSEERYRRHVRRVQRVLRLLAGRRTPGVETQEVRVPRRGGGPPIRVVLMRPPVGSRSGERQPSAARPAPGIVWIHGGGYAIGVPEVDSRVHRMLVLEHGCVVLAPDYRVSTEAPYPAALDDCYDTLLWMKDHASELGVDADRLMVGGQSAGGGLAAAVSLRARDTGEAKIALQVPLYPMLDDRMQTESARENNAPVWNSDTNRWAWRLYLGDRFGGDVPAWAAPARAEDFHGLPPTVTFVGDLEPFRDETIAYVDRLRDAGVPVRFEVFERCFHAFDVVNPHAEVSERARAFWTEGLSE